MPRGRPKRGHCDACPAVKGIRQLLIAGKRIDLCEHCRATLKRIEAERRQEIAASGTIVAEELA
jgi:hypothetical protein